MNKILRKLFRPRGDEVHDDWRKLHNEGLHNLYTLPNIMTIKSKRMKYGNIQRRNEKCI